MGAHIGMVSSMAGFVFLAEASGTMMMTMMTMME
jgi:hypothetical protein